MFERERLAVHSDREHGVATVHDDCCRRADGEPIDGPGDDLVRGRVDTGLPEEIGERRPYPPGVADVAPTDRVGDTRQGHVALHQGSRQQRRVIERQLVANHAVDPEAPSLGGDRRDEQLRVHPVEDVGRARCSVGHDDQILFVVDLSAHGEPQDLFAQLHEWIVELRVLHVFPVLGKLALSADRPGEQAKA